MFPFLLLLMPPRVFPPSPVADPAPAVTPEVKPTPAPAVAPPAIPEPTPVIAKPTPVITPSQPSATTAPRWVAPVAPTYPMQPARRMYYQPPSRTCVNGRCYVSPGYWYYR